MALKFGLSLPQGWTMELASIKDPVEAYEAMTRVAQTADEVGFESIWLVDHFHTIPQPSQEVTFECWTTTAAIARDTRRIRVGQMVTCNGYLSSDCSMIASDLRTIARVRATAKDGSRSSYALTRRSLSLSLCSA